MTTVDWTQGDDWDTLYLGDEAVPGTARVDAKVKDGRDKQKGRGSKRHRTKNDGPAGVNFRISIEMLPGEADAFRERILPIIYKATRASIGGAVTIAHPQAAFYGVQSVTIGEISTGHPKPGGSWTISIEADEYVPEPAPVKEAPPEPPSDEPVNLDDLPTLAEQVQKKAFG